MEKVVVRRETEADHRTVERIMREAFWDLYVPGCSEHYLAHVIRDHEDFIPELDLVMEVEGKIIGGVMYTKSALIDETGEHKTILTFGPVGILPEYQHRGYGKILLEHSFREAEKLGYDTIVIFGSPNNYVGLGFISCKKKNVCLGGGVYPFAMLVKELKPSVLDGRKWVYQESPAYQAKDEEVEAFDRQFETKVKNYRPSQEVFYIQSRSVLR